MTRRRKRVPQRSQLGAASVEHAGLAALIALLVIAALSALAAGPNLAGRELGSAIGRKISCAPRLPLPCHRNPLALAYGFPLGKLVRALAPAPLARPGPEGVPLVPVDFRYCRRPSCAVPRPGSGGLHLTASLRRSTAFTEVIDRRRAGGGVTVTYWLYRPRIGWERIVRTGHPGDIDAASEIRLRISDDPALVPLETLPGRNHYEFPRGEEPPWRWRVITRYPG